MEVNHLAESLGVDSTHSCCNKRRAIKKQNLKFLESFKNKLQVKQPLLDWKQPPGSLNKGAVSPPFYC